MKIHIRMYKPHDQDIYALYSVLGQKKFIKLITEILHANCAGCGIDIEADKTSLRRAYTDMPQKVSFIATLNEQKYPDETRLLEKTKKNGTNAFIKLLIRMYTGYALSSIFTDSSIAPCMATVSSHAAENKDAEKRDKDIGISTTVYGQDTEQVKKEAMEQKPGVFDIPAVSPVEDTDTMQDTGSLGDLFDSLVFE